MVGSVGASTLSGRVGRYPSRHQASTSCASRTFGSDRFQVRWDSETPTREVRSDTRPISRASAITSVTCASVTRAALANLRISRTPKPPSFRAEAGCRARLPKTVVVAATNSNACGTRLAGDLIDRGGGSRNLAGCGVKGCPEAAPPQRKSHLARHDYAIVEVAKKHRPCHPPAFDLPLESATVVRVSRCHPGPGGHCLQLAAYR